MSTTKIEYHKVRKPVGVWRAVELSDVHDIVLILKDGGLVIVNIEIIGSRKDGDERGETSVVRLLVHSIPARKLRRVRVYRNADFDWNNL